MKHKLLILTFLVLFSQYSIAQSRLISGVVKSSEDGLPIPGASVIVQGTTIGTVTGMDGEFSLSVPDGGTFLRISFVGMAPREIEIGNRTSFDISLEPEISALNEVVVTALGVSRDERSIGYAVQSIQGDKLSSVREPNVVGSLAGKVAGVQVIGSSGAALGGTQNIRLRGINSLGGGSPLFVVDGTPISNQSFSPNNDSPGRDYGNLAADINPDDIESISVLKGPSAAALYGNRAANGVIIITTKKGTSKKGIGVEFNQSTTFDRVYVLPSYQNEYAGGYTQDLLTFNFNPDVHPASWSSFNGQPMLNYAADESWGPRMDGTPVRHWDSWYPGENFGEMRPLTPQPNNVRDFFNTGVTYNTGVALSGGDQESNFRLSLNNVSQSGVMPNSSLMKNNVSFNGSHALTDRFTAGINFNYTGTEGTGRPASGYTGRNPVNSFNQWFQRQIDMDRLSNYRAPDGSFRTWNIRAPNDLRPLYWDNPYYEVMQNAPEDKRDRVFGNFNLGYQINDDLKITGFARTDFYNQKIEERISSGGLDLDQYSVRQIVGREDNYELLVQYNKTFGDLSVSANGGGNIRRDFYDFMYQQTVGGLAVPNFYNIEASVDRPVNQSFSSRKTVRSLYGSMSLGYQNTIFLDATLRNDWSSALPVNNNSYIYPSLSTSFVFSELMSRSDKTFSYGKVRLSYAQVGSDIDAYQIANIYNVGLPYQSLPNLSVPTTFPNPTLRPALSSSYEAGVDLRFFNGRAGLDVTVYRNDNTDQIMTLTVPGSSGYTGAIVNAGNIRSEGLEVMLTGTPIQKRDFSWDVSLNFSRFRNEVVELAEGLENRLLQSAYWGMTLNARVGEPWGTLIGNGFTTNEAGVPVIREDGSYVMTQNKLLGTVLPKATGGFSNTFRYNNWDLTAFTEFQLGGKFYSVTKMFNAYSGLSAETAGLNDLGNPMRDPVDQGGGIRVDGVSESGQPLTVYMDPYDHFSGMFGLHERWIYDATFFKLRELRLGYTLPSSIISRTPFHTANVGIIARNLWLIHTNVDGLDPSEFGSGANGLAYFESGQLPGVRSLGFNIRLGL
ncbi:SusC/RagA family TonB-linked outer membrane protein [Litoribacter alkaliphilus]|uniref:SusC/RagA family TonB-linked outer membrane protein n=1 Tax=Litoribacter ruber TaxID=702568 RepID=A0AAP2G5K0_9BACT|nr:SusC/RagA family TonB-linked outer membrane protein [Litoribacter alkaliphilus]MBS9525620.1 SusC/RagA family TonB-linked outer membrane protein [Litoribacter alkaliphilus]